MNDDQHARLEIMRALEKDFPDRVLEDLIDMARYVEVGGIERARLKGSAERFIETFRDTTPTPGQDDTKPRIWGLWAEVPEMVAVSRTASISPDFVYRKTTDGEIQRTIRDGEWESSWLTHEELQTYAPFTEVPISRSN